MKGIRIILSIAVLCLVASSCGLYDKYESNIQIPSDVIGVKTVDSLSVNSTTMLSWREFFTDPLLQNLIDMALINNTDVNSARIAVEQNEVALQMAKNAILPSLFFSPSGTIANFNSNTSKTYNLPLQVSWDSGQIGSYTNKKRAKNAVLMQTQASQDAVRANLISAVAQ